MLAATLLLSWVVSAFAAKEVCYSKQRYSLTMAVGDEVFALHAEEYGTLGEIALVAHPKHQRKPGTPISEHGVSGHANIDVDFKDSVYHLTVGDLGEVSGASELISGQPADFHWPHWYYEQDTIEPQLTSGAQWYMACDFTAHGKTHKALSFGTHNQDGSLPKGCSTTVVKKEYDVKIPC